MENDKIMAISYTFTIEINTYLMINKQSNTSTATIPLH